MPGVEGSHQAEIWNGRLAMIGLSAGIAVLLLAPFGA